LHLTYLLTSEVAYNIHNPRLYRHRASGRWPTDTKTVSWDDVYQQIIMADCQKRPLCRDLAE